ncbi:MAG: hypothetical protein M5U28_54065, partial [Sandaracinaceae bacterium]|nr:hypothetical protein [Sandaracinaceae bacterium]
HKAPAPLYAAIEEGFSGEQICKTTLGLIIQAVFGDGFFTPNPHPGNLSSWARRRRRSSA